ncbi:MAG: insulinase family protein [Gemmatimonadota bacterium]|nr:insulinase family protein [Gemmatimonadota bacterium]
MKQGELPNGLQILASTSHAFPVVTLSLLLPAGATTESADLGGLASLTADLLESGTSTRDAATLAEQVEGMGVRVDVSATWDWTHVGITGLRRSVQKTAVLLADLARNPVFPPSEVERVRAERIAEISQSRADPRGLADEAVIGTIFAPETPFSRPLGGTPATVGRISREDAAVFHASRFSPRGATLIAAGDLDSEAVRGLADRVFGDWGGTAPDRPEPQIRAAAGEGRVFVVDRPGSVQTELRLGHVGVPRDTPDFFPLLVMNAILGGTFSSRLNLNLRERHGYTYGVHSQWVMRRAPGFFSVSTAVQTDRAAAAAGEVLREIRRLQDEPVAAGELDDARSYLAGVFPLRAQTTDGVAGRLATLAAYDLPLDYFDSYRDRILAVTAEEVLRVARERLHPERLTIVAVGDARLLRSDLETLGHGPVVPFSLLEDE